MAPDPTPTLLRPGARRRRAVLAGVGVGLVLLVVLTTITIALAEHAVRREAERRVATTAELSAQVVAQRARTAAVLVSQTAIGLEGIGTPSAAQLRPDDVAAGEAAVRRLQRAVPGASGALLLDAGGRVILGAGAAVPPRRTDLSGLEWVRRLRDGPGHQQPSDPYLSKAYPAPGAGSADPSGRTTALAAWIVAPDGRRLGVLAAVLGPTALEVQAPREGSFDTALTLTDQAGVLVTSAGRSDRGLVALTREGPVARALRGDSGVEVRDRAGRPTVSGYAPVAGTGWTVTADVPAADAFADVTRLRVLLLAAAAVAGFGLVFVVPLLVLRLARAREQVAIGERFQADLLPTEMPPGVLAHYRASERRLLLGGDFLDAVHTPDGGLALLVGDVCGHGPRAAALGARLRAGWRTLATAGEPVGRLDLLDRLVASERPDEELYATVAVAWISPAEDVVRYALAGHPPLLLDQGAEVIPLEEGRGAALGLGIGGPWDVTEHELWPGWTLALYSDGLIEAKTGRGPERLEVAGLERLMVGARGAGVVDPAAFVAVVQGLDQRGEVALEDDVALLVASGVRGGRPASPRAAVAGDRA